MSGALFVRNLISQVELRKRHGFPRIDDDAISADEGDSIR